MSELRAALEDLGYTLARETRLLRLTDRLGMKRRPWVIAAEHRFIRSVAFESDPDLETLFSGEVDVDPADSNQDDAPAKRPT